MATSQSHTLGEFIGAFFEDLMKKPIKDFADNNGLYFDSIGPRKARRGKKVTWTDVHGSKHDLDFVLERGGSAKTIGAPVAFIELAWRRYTKHSKNKAQEISGAVNPICERFSLSKPFKGAILSGQFTTNSINQLKNDNFHVLYIPFERLVQAFRNHGIDIYFDETTNEDDIKNKYTEISKPENSTKLNLIREEILKSCEKEIKQFVSELALSLNRTILSISILPLHGLLTEVLDVEKAIDFINNYRDVPKDSKLEYIEITVNYNNGTTITGRFKEKIEAVDFLKKIQ